MTIKQYLTEPPVLASPETGDTLGECKTHRCFEFISHAILSILYPYSCKTHNISSKLGFEGFFFMEI